MPELSLVLESSSCLPGGNLRGRISWDCAKTPRRLILALKWRTEGRGNAESGCVGELHLPCRAAKGEAEFELEIPPRIPPSYRGRLVSILWQIEARADLAFAFDCEISRDIDILGVVSPEPGGR
ncbi:MAG: hypothetical protein RL095_971 [Verrucomicrobiota bacterium]|jgi:hypothetical protein